MAKERKKALNDAVQGIQKKKKRPPGWHGNSKKLSNTERMHLGLAPLPENEARGNRYKSPNLKKNKDGSVTNQYGVRITAKERSLLEREVNKANRTRMKMLEDEAALPRMSDGKDTGLTVKSLQALGKESDFILARKSKSLQGFKSRDEFKRYLRNVQRVNSPNYLRDRIRMYKRNHITALENAFGEDAKDVVNKIRNMKQKDYMEAIQSEELLEISYLYEPTKRTGKLNRIRARLGLKLREEIEDPK